MTRFLGNTSQENPSARRPVFDFPPASSPSSPFPDIIDLMIAEDTLMLGVIEEGDKEDEGSASFASKGKGAESDTGTSDQARFPALKCPHLSSSPKDKPLLKRRSPPSKLGPSIILQYKTDFLDVSPPLTTVGGCPPQAHPFLTSSIPERAIWNDPYL